MADAFLLWVVPLGDLTGHLVMLREEYHSSGAFKVSHVAVPFVFVFICGFGKLVANAYSIGHCFEFGWTKLVSSFAVPDVSISQAIC